MVGPSLEFAYLPETFSDYMGFRFFNSTEPGWHYRHVPAVGNAEATMVSLTQYAYESVANTAIPVVPEPSRLAMLALGTCAVWPCTAIDEIRSNVRYHRPRSCFEY